MKSISAIDFFNSQESFTIVDVRTPEEFNQGYIKNAILIDCYGDDLEEQLNTLDSQKKYVIYCRSGARSAHVVSILEEKGFLDVYNLEGGILDWKLNNFPLI